MVKLNIGAYRATHQRELDHVADPIGPENRDYLGVHAHQASSILLACGNAHRKLQWEFELTVKWLAKHGDLWCLGTTKSGYPKHPSRLAKTTQRSIYRPDGGGR